MLPELTVTSFNHTVVPLIYCDPCFYTMHGVVPLRGLLVVCGLLVPLSDGYTPVSGLP
jgi:hypothetical protein